MGKLIISYDCEGLWGFLDHLNKDNKKIEFEKNELIYVYKKLIKLHEKYCLEATFAFVGSLCLEEKLFFKFIDKHPNAIYVREWLKTITNPKIKENLFIPELLKIVEKSKIKHEIASHGFTHCIMDENMKIDDIKLEYEGINLFKEKFKINLKTIIFPRNIISKDFLDYSKLFIGFRMQQKSMFKNKFFIKFFSLFREIIPIAISDKGVNENGYIGVPGNFFLNWRFGFRKLIPMSITLLRFKFIINHAIKNNKTVGLWMHPHNLITGHKQFFLLEEIFKYAKLKVSEKKLEVITQDNFVKLFNLNYK